VLALLHPGYSSLTFLRHSLGSLCLFVVAFALFEKVAKERFVIGLTNAKTKKLALQLINQIPNPIALVGKKGELRFFNGPFEELIRNRLGLKIMPQNIFRLANEEDGSGNKLRSLVEEITKNGNPGQIK
jgi:hypothetical protein